jgi:hypothetical protein
LRFRKVVVVLAHEFLDFRPEPIYEPERKSLAVVGIS